MYMTLSESITSHMLTLLEANYKLAFAYGYRSWYNPQKQEWIKVPFFNSTHQREVLQNPSAFGIDPETLDGCNENDPKIMNEACSLGWVRIAGEDRREPSTGMIFEGNDLPTLLRVLRMFVGDMGGELRNASIKVRSGHGDGGQEYTMVGADAVKAAAYRRELPSPHHFGENNELLAA